MTPSDMRAIRKRVAPHLSQAAFATALGYRDRATYRKYENGSHWPPHPLLVRLMLLLDERGSLPDDFAAVAAEPVES